MRKSNSEILNKVKNVVNEKKKKNPSYNNLSNNKTNELQNPKSQILSIYSLNTELFDPQHQIIKSR